MSNWFSWLSAAHHISHAVKCVEVLVLVIFDIIARSMAMILQELHLMFLSFSSFGENAHMAGWQNVRVCERCALVDSSFTLRVLATRFFSVLPSLLIFSLRQRLQRCSNDVQRLCFDSCVAVPLPDSQRSQPHSGHRERWGDLTWRFWEDW